MALFHHHTLAVAVTGLTSIVTFGLLTGRLDLMAHLGHEWVVLANLFGLLVGFALLADHFERSNVPELLPKFLPDALELCSHPCVGPERREFPRRVLGRGESVLYGLSLSAFLFAFWLLLSGYFEPFLVAAGAGSALAVAAFARRMKVLDGEGHPIHLGVPALVYWTWLAKEILKSALTVSRIILDPRLPISPTLVRFTPSQSSIVGLVTHANSITLTPGTITVETEGGEFLVHGLTKAFADGCTDSEMDRRVSRLEGPR